MRSLLRLIASACLLAFPSWLLVLLISLPAYAQITVPDTVPPYEPIIAGCNCIIPKGATVLFMWRTDAQSKSVVVGVNGEQLHVWAPPGPHYIEAIVIVQTFVDQKIIEPDPDHPDDRTKDKVKTIKVQKSLDVQRYEKGYSVTGTPPTPPGPTPPGPTPPGPTPPVPPSLTGIAKLAYDQAMLIPTTHRSIASRLADNAESVSAGLAAGRFADIEAAAKEYTTMNRSVVGTTGPLRDAWIPFFKVIQVEFDAKVVTQDQYVAAWADLARGLRQVSFTTPQFKSVTYYESPMANFHRNSKHPYALNFPTLYYKEN